MVQFIFQLAATITLLIGQSSHVGFGRRGHLLHPVERPLDAGAAGSLAAATGTVPARVGVSLKNYYQGFDGDHRFGFFDVGGLLTVPLNRSGGAYGRWNLHGGVDVYLLGDTPKVVFNNGSKTKIVGLVGLGLRY